ncbi:MAG: DMT family transporter [Candidatus Thorarchaeota archaeon]
MLIIGVAAALIAAFSWAISAALYKTGANDVSPLTANFIRILAPISILAFIALLLNLYPQVLFLSPWEWFLIIGSSLFAFVIGDALYFVAIQKLGVSRGVPITSTYPLFVLLFQILFLAQPVHWLMIPAALLTVSGIALLGYQLNKTAQNEALLTRSLLWIGIFAAIGTAISWSISTIFLSVVLQNTDLVLIAVIRLSLALAIMSPFICGLQFVKPEKTLTRQKLIYLSIGGIFALTIGYVAFARALQLMDTTSVALLSSLTPLFAAFIGWRSLQERLDFKTLLAIIACVVGVILITFAVSLV